MKVTYSQSCIDRFECSQLVNYKKKLLEFIDAAIDENILDYNSFRDATVDFFFDGKVEAYTMVKEFIKQ